MEKVATRGIVMIFSPILRPSFLGVHESKDCRDGRGWSTILATFCFIVPDAAHTCKWQSGLEFMLLGLALGGAALWLPLPSHWGAWSEVVSTRRSHVARRGRS